MFSALKQHFASDSRLPMWVTAAKRTMLLSLGSIIGRMVPLSFLIWESERLTKVDYNTISAAFMWATVASSLVATGISTVATQKIAKETTPKERQSIFLAFYIALLGASGIFIILWLALGERIISLMYGSTIQSGLYLPAALIGWIWPQVTFFSSILNGAHKTKAAASLIAVCGICQGAGMLSADIIFDSHSLNIAWGLAVGSFVAAIIGGRITISALTEQLKIAWRPDLRVLQGSHLSMLISTVSSTAVLPIGFLAGSIISRSNDGSAELSQYFFLEQINQAIVYFPAILGQVLMPMISQRINEVANADNIYAIRRSCQIIIQLFMLSIICAVLIGVFIGYLIDFANLAKLREDAVWATRWMLVNAFMTLPLTFLGAVTIGAGHIKFGSMSNVIWGICVLSGTASLISFGNAGFQASRAMASLVVLVLGVSFLLQTYRIPRRNIS